LHNYIRTKDGITFFIVLLLLFSFILCPLFWMFDIAIRTNFSAYNHPTFLFQGIVGIKNFLFVINDKNILVYFKNSMIISISTVVLTLLLAIPAAYSLAVCDIPFKNIFLILITIPQFIPSIIRLIPTYLLFQKIGLNNTRMAMILFHSSHLTLSIWLLKSYFESIKRAYFEDAILNGANHFVLMLKVVIPLSLPAIAAVSIQIFNGSWNAFLSAMLFLLDESKKTVPLGLYQYIDRYDINYSMLSAFNIISIIPTVILFYLLRFRLKYIEEE